MTGKKESLLALMRREYRQALQGATKPPRPARPDKKTYVSGSEMAAIMGVSPWQQAHDVWALKTGRKKPDPPTPAMIWGSRLEKVIVKVFSKRWIRDGQSLERPSFRLSQEYPWIGGIPDGIIRDSHGTATGILEIKTASAFSRHRWRDKTAKTDIVPEYYRWQAETYMSMYDVPFAVFAVLCGGSDYFEVTVEADAQRLKTMTQAAYRFVNDHLLVDMPPPIDYKHPTAKRTIDGKYPKASGEIVFDGRALELAREYRDVAARAKEAKSRESALQAEILDLMGNAQIARFADPNLGIIRRSYVRRAEGSGYSKLVFQ